MSHVLIVDDEESICWGLSRVLTETGHEVSVAASAEEAFQSAAQRPPDLVVLDVRLPGMDGLSAMQRLAETAGPIPIVVITAFGNLDVAVTAMRNGAFDYLAKPFDLDWAMAVIERGLAQGKHQPAPTPAESWPVDQELLGTGPAMQEVFKRIALVAPTDASVLITGDSGTGKELVARAIHRHSARADRPFVPIHLTSLSPTLVESELFGHVRGAFNGAESTRAGLLELAHGATVFFDEVNDLPPALQLKLLDVLEQQKLTPVGSTQSRPSAVRVIAATQGERSDQTGATLRQDLYFRLAGFEIHLPPLRERAEDIPLLAEYFLRRVPSVNVAQARFTPEAMHELCRRSWPGNVRQLRHAVEHGALLARGGQIAVEHLPAAADAQPATLSHELAAVVSDWAKSQLAKGSAAGHLHDAFLSQVEPPLFEAVLKSTGQNRAAAADVLGIHRATLRKKLNANSDANGE